MRRAVVIAIVAATCATVPPRPAEVAEKALLALDTAFTVWYVARVDAAPTEADVVALDPVVARWGALVAAVGAGLVAARGGDDAALVAAIADARAFLVTIGADP
ncbi:MAG: hypothetical protein ABIE42_09140 [Candidatus Eisenbacteria bacterium]